MKLDKLDTVMLDDEGKPFEDGMTLRKSLVIAARYFNPNAEETHEDKYRAGTIAVKLNKAQKSVRLSSEEIQLLKNRIKRIMAPILVVRLFDALEEEKSAEERIAGDLDPEVTTAA